MNILRKLFAKFVEWLQPKHNIKFVEELPQQIKDDLFYLVGEHSSPWLIAFTCPCGCGSLIQLNLLKEACPCWKYQLEGDKISITPSIWRKAGCRSHFFIRKGETEWVKEYRSEKPSSHKRRFRFFKA